MNVVASSSQIEYNRMCVCLCVCFGVYRCVSALIKDKIKQILRDNNCEFKDLHCKFKNLIKTGNFTLN